MDHRHSYRLSFADYARTEFFRQECRCEYIDGDAKQVCQLNGDCRQIKQGGFFSRLNQQVEVAVVAISAAHRRTEYPYVAHAMALGDPANSVAMAFQGFGRAHVMQRENGLDQRRLTRLFERRGALVA